MRSRRDDYSESTRSALVRSAVRLFTERGYAGTSLDEIAKNARVTKGALYHHFSGKQAVFEAAFDEVESDVKGRLEKILTGSQPPWDRAMSGLREFIQICLDPAYQRLALHEAPVVMGWQRWREAEDRYSFGLIKQALQDLIDAGEVLAVPVEVTSRLLFGALVNAATEIAGSADPRQVGAQIEDVIVSLLNQVRRTES
ncbi:TetR family transcriptional regulator [Saccharomonospora sp. CUA-673]|uniref:TetR/AcrR family transcriptional regulator n=1 Tax=Saccharomonospora sp. CUA-673 TaxID=1904969 RepID=UPI000965C075|nr:TetR/AcrR family transcriptional regulator [Saccharomonospora sp. CUA-673]OLT46956.1 TetR family transcriptional regulator [Saccharomonospora sp. CUA-673]